MRKIKTNTKVNRNQFTTMNEVTMAKRNQFLRLRDHALRNDHVFLAEYYENMGKAIR